MNKSARNVQVGQPSNVLYSKESIIKPWLHREMLRFHLPEGQKHTHSNSKIYQLYGILQTSVTAMVQQILHWITGKKQSFDKIQTITKLWQTLISKEQQLLALHRLIRRSKLSHNPEEWHFWRWLKSKTNFCRIELVFVTSREWNINMLTMFPVKNRNRYANEARHCLQYKSSQPDLDKKSRTNEQIARNVHELDNHLMCCTLRNQ